MLEAGRRSRVSWVAVVQVLAARGITAPDGKPLKPGTAKRAYYRMLRRKNPTTRPAREPPPVVVEVAPRASGQGGEAAPAAVAEDPMARLRAQIDAGKRKLPRVLGS